MRPKYLGFKLILCCFFVFHQAFAQNANYDIDVTLNPKLKTLKGKQILTWTNPSSVPTQELQFHLYLNAFKDLRSSFMRESGGQLRNDKANTQSKDNFGHITIQSIAINNSNNLSSKLQFIQPDDNNSYDRTVVRIQLDKPILPQQTIQIAITFEAKLPKVFARTGWAKNDFFMVGQWFPKIGVFENTGQWNCHQFHADTEFYADFGNYNVNITLPESYKIGATGQLTSVKKINSSQKKVSFSAKNVHDFAWTTSPHYKEFSEKYDGITLKVLMQPEHAYLASRYFDAVKKAIAFMKEKVGPYPYPTLTLVDPSRDASGASGMEYPNLITCGSMWGVGSAIKYQELVTIHEFVHQYFQGMLASNEFENAWLDEGFTQYYEGRIMDAVYPQGAVFQLGKFYVNDAQMSRQDYTLFQAKTIAPIRTNVWEMPKGTYSTLAYTKPATVLKTLENYIGTERMDELMRKYFQKFQFKHPTPSDFFNVAKDVLNSSFDSDKFFHQTILESHVCDYSLKNLQSSPKKSSFQLRNLGTLQIPVEVLVSFTDKKTHTFIWDGKAKNFTFNKEIEKVEIDPNLKNWMDVDLTNQFISIKKEPQWALKYALNFWTWLQLLFF